MRLPGDHEFRQSGEIDFTDPPIMILNVFDGPQCVRYRPTIYALFLLEVFLNIYPLLLVRADRASSIEGLPGSRQGSVGP